jgi:V/A-type H+/Na+-transporting ATPase subunit E
LVLKYEGEAEMQDAGFLIDKIREDALTQVKNILAKAEKEAEDILSEARADAEKIRNDMNAKAYLDAEGDKKRAVSNSVLDNKKKVLEAKNDLIGKAFSKAAEAIKQMDSREYEKLLTRLVIGLVEEGEARVFVAYNDRSRLSPGFIDNINKILESMNIKSNVSYSTDDYDINDGFVLFQERYLIDVSVTNLIDMHRDELESKIVKMLFE